MRRRDLLQALGVSAVLAACGDLSFAGGATPTELTRADAVRLSDEEWRALLTPMEFRVLRLAGTERAFTGDLLRNKQDGVYVCAGCALPLFDSRTKFDSGTGWPSYTAPIGDHVIDKIDRSLGMARIENVCARCGGHLGHVFPDGPKPTGQRYCINAVSLDFVPRAEAGELGPVKLGGIDKPTAPKGETP
jgi:peptide-methionine (R)-S-oxide reductase